MVKIILQLALVEMSILVLKVFQPLVYASSGT